VKNKKSKYLSIKSRKGPVSKLITIWIVLLLGILFIDFIDVKFLNDKGLVFKFHLYSHGASFLIANICFYFVINKHPLSTSKIFDVLFSIFLTSIWWITTFWVLMTGFHGFIGGTY
jgi:hypothetical protein